MSSRRKEGTKKRMIQEEQGLSKLLQKMRPSGSGMHPYLNDRQRFPNETN